MNEAERLARAVEIARELKRRVPWEPLKGPQTMAYTSNAQVIGYGGAAGGGKTDLACGLAITKHHKVLVLRREATQLTGVIDRFTELIGRDGYNGQDKIWRVPERDLQIELGSTPHAGDETKYQGRPHDLLVFDEATNFLESHVRFLMGWVRSTRSDVACKTLLTFNPPTTADGRWILQFFAPWLDKNHPNPAESGELRYFATVEGKELECENGAPFELNGETVVPMSRTFIPSRISDNPYLANTGYMAVLQALPEPLRSQMLYGDFTAGTEDDPWQVIPTAWVEVAMARWQKPAKLETMDSVGVDVARGGKDKTVIARRHGMWFDEPLDYDGSQTPDGPKVAGLVIAAMRDSAVLHLDVIGVGSSPYDFLAQARQQIVGVNVAEKATDTDLSGRLRFFNLRSQLWWQMREALDPANNSGIQLPPNNALRADLCAPTWEMSGTTVKVESRDEIVKRIGRSPDFASAYILALIKTPKRNELVLRGHQSGATADYDPLDHAFQRYQGQN